jgi:hypothetical protein
VQTDVIAECPLFAFLRTNGVRFYTQFRRARPLADHTHHGEDEDEDEGEMFPRWPDDDDDNHDYG